MQDERGRPPAAASGRKTSIRTRVAIVVFGAVTAGAVAISGFSIWKGAESSRETAVANHERITQLLAAQVSGAVRFKKADAIEASTGPLQHDPAAFAVHFVTVDTEGSIVAESGDAPEPGFATAAATEAARTNGFVAHARGVHDVTAAPVLFGPENAVIGAIAITWDTSAHTTRLRNLMILTLAGALVIGVGVALLINLAMRRWISRPIAGVTRMMEELAGGNLDFALEGTERRDEIGAMARAVQVFRDNELERRRLASEQERDQQERAARQQRVDTLIGQFRHDVQARLTAISASMEEMRATASSLMGIADTTAGGAEGASAASRQASQNVQAVASAAEELAASIGEIGRQVGDTNAVVLRAAEGTRRTNEQISGLAEAANKIGKVLELISEIAGQTNLLALNATIEAARAGEHGKGFAVVAAEVKTLASQTAKATEEISAQIGAIQSSTGDAVAAIAEISRTMEEVSGFTAAIAAAVSQQGEATAEISRNVQEAATGTGDAATQIGGVTSGASETNQAASQVQMSSAEIARRTQELSGVVDRFLADVA